MDPIDVMTELRASHDAGNRDAGLNLFSGNVEDNLVNGIIEPLRVKTQAIASASEVAIMSLSFFGQGLIGFSFSGAMIGSCSSFHRAGSPGDTGD